MNLLSVPDHHLILQECTWRTTLRQRRRASQEYARLAFWAMDRTLPIPLCPSYQELVGLQLAHELLEGVAS